MYLPYSTVVPVNVCGGRALCGRDSHRGNNSRDLLHSLHGRAGTDAWFCPWNVASRD